MFLYHAVEMIFSTPRLQLRPMLQSDAPALFAILGDRAAMMAFGQGMQQASKSYSSVPVYTPGQHYGTTVPSYQPSKTWTANGNTVSGSNGVSMQSFGNRDVITYPDGRTRTCSTVGSTTTCN